MQTQLPNPFMAIATASEVDSEDQEMDFIISLSPAGLRNNDTGEQISGVLLGQEAMLVITMEINPIFETARSSVEYQAILEIRNDDGVTIGLFTEGGTLSSESPREIDFSWTPKVAGEFEARVFVISAFDNPEILSKVYPSTITVANQTGNLDELPTTSDGSDDVSAEQNHDPVAISTLANYTVLIYMVASDLESGGYYATQDIMEMMSASSSPSVNVIVQTGGAANATIDDIRFIDFTKVQRHIVVHDRVVLLDDLGGKNMASAQTLSQFVRWGINEFPANRYAIILWDHGAGVLGFGFDDIYNDTLTLGEINEGLQPAKIAGDKMEIIGFDACLMASIEVAREISSMGNYLVASEELETAWGWDYSAILSSLQQDPGQDGRQLGKVIADSYVVHTQQNSATYDDYGFEQFVTLSVIDLDKVPTIVKNVDDLGDFLGLYFGDEHTTYSITKTVRQTERYGDAGRDSSGHLDLYHFAQNFDSNFPEQLGLAAKLGSSVEEAVVYRVNGSARPDAHGISIFMQMQEYEAGAPYLRHIIGSWVAVFDFGRKVLASDNIPPSVSLIMNHDANNTISGRIGGEDISTISHFITEEVENNNLKLRILSIVDMEASEFMSNADESGKINFVWDRKIMSLCNSDEQDCQPTSVWFEKSGNIDLAYLPARLEGRGYNGTLVLIYLINDNGGFSFIGGWPGIDEHGNAIRELVPLVPGDKIYTEFYELVYVPASDETRWDTKESEDPIVVSEGFGVMHHRYPGEYDLIISACDYSENCAYSDDFHFEVEE